MKVALICLAAHLANVAWAEPYHIIVDKKAHKVYLYNGSACVRDYRVDTGKNPRPKTEEGDCCTPEGSYRVIEKVRKESRKYGTYFLRLNYPNYGDVVKGYTGFGIGIHGTRRRVLGNNTTLGCIVMRDTDVRHLAGHVRLGTPVLIYADLGETQVLPRFNRYISPGPPVAGQVFTLRYTVWFKEIKAVAPSSGRVILAFRTEFFDIAERQADLVDSIYVRGDFRIVEIERGDWKETEKKDFQTKLIPKRPGELEYSIRLVFRYPWGFTTHPPYGFFDPTGFPAKFEQIAVRQ